MNEEIKDLWQCFERISKNGVIDKTNPQYPSLIETSKTQYSRFIDKFNSIKVEIVNSFIIQKIIQQNNNKDSFETTQQKDQFEITLSCNIRKFNEINNKLLKTCALLKNLLIHVCPEDSRLSPKGLINQFFGHPTDRRIFTIPGDTNPINIPLKLTREMVQVPASWENGFTDMAFDLSEKKEEKVETVSK